MLREVEQSENLVNGRMQLFDIHPFSHKTIFYTSGYDPDYERLLVILTCDS